MEAVAILRYSPRPGRSRLARLGDWMARHRRAILALQWAVVAFYVLLVALPAFLPHPNPEARLFSSDLGASSFVDPNFCAAAPGDAAAPHDKAPYVAGWRERLVLLAQYLFWGIWWPFVILSVMFLGRVWCGVLCPEGALSEFASRHGRANAIPRWLRWSGWPAVAFVLTTIYGQLISVYEYPQAALLILGGSTLAAMLIGYLYGRGKRVWCRYLCPVTGVFALLARLAPLHFRVDRDAWRTHAQRTGAVDCAPLLPVSHLQGMAECHACGRCSGHRGAVELAWRPFAAETLAGPPPATAEALLLIFGLLGVAMGAFQWTVSPWFVRAKQLAAAWLLDRDIAWPLDTDAPWWLLTHAPAAGDLFSWLDGALILAYILAVALVLGGAIWLAVAAAARLAGLDWRRLALGLTPLAGIGLFLGLSMMTANFLRAEGMTLSWLAHLRAVLLFLGAVWSGWLGLRLVASAGPGIGRRTLALAAWLAPVAAVVASWALVFNFW
ncbi:MAG TPA: 4Fe-4S binding protein [Rhodocyclaceae bacterium]|nr:4Fe-4S binding protein [Rhodocyclaceae bacterium]